MGSAVTDQKNRARLRRTLRIQGLSPAAIEAVISRKAAEQLAARNATRRVHGLSPVAVPTKTPSRVPAGAARIQRQRAGQYRRAEENRRRLAEQLALEREQGERERRRVEDETYRKLNPDDRRFRPPHVDPLMTGPARATGFTAKAARRGKTYAKWQMDEAPGEPIGP